MSSSCRRAVIVKHANPCGVAVAATVEEAWERALAADPVSAFGCVAVLNRAVGAELGVRISQHFAEVLLAPGYEDGGARSAPREEDAAHPRRSRPPPERHAERDYKRVEGGLLVQDRDDGLEDRESMQLVAGEIGAEQWEDLLFAWRVCKHVSSNAIVLVRELQTIGIGAGQMSRVDCGAHRRREGARARPRHRGRIARERCVFPVRRRPADCPRCGRSPRSIQPGGSIRDDQTIAAVDAAGAAMVFTGRRHFRH